MISKEFEDIEPTDCLTDIPDPKYWTEILEGKDKMKKNCVILDDLEFSSRNKDRLHNLGLLYRYMSTHRNMTIICSHQSFFDLPPTVKKMSNVFFVYKPRRMNWIDRKQVWFGQKFITLYIQKYCS